MRNFSNKSCREKYTSSVQSFYSEDRAVHEIMSKNMVEPERPAPTLPLQKNLAKSPIVCYITIVLCVTLESLYICRPEKY
jgi:hypothetical protein